MKKWIFLFIAVVILLFFSKSHANTFVFSEALIWQIREANSTNWGQILTPASSNETIQFLDVPFKWKPGLRVGIGYNNPDNPWNILFYYTGYKTKGRNQANTDSGEIHSAFSSNFYANNPQGNGISGPYYHRSDIDWDVEFNTLDLELGQSFNIGSLASIHPYSGLKGGIINQTIDSNWHDPYRPATSANPNPAPITTFTSATEVITNDFRGLGPSIGLDTNWHLYTNSYQSFNLVGSLSGAFLWGKWTFSDVYRNNTPQTVATISDSLSSSAFMAKTFLGIEWSNNIRNVNWNLRLGYEIQAWFNQLQYYSFDMGKTNDTLYLQGTVLGFGVYF